MEIDDLMNRIEKLEKEIKDLHKRTLDILAPTPALELRVRVPDENTPVNTVVKDSAGHRFFFKKIDVGNKIYFSTNPLSEINVDRNDWDIICNFVIDTVADLRFRMFLNAPEDYRWGAVDKDGEGYVYKNKPVLGEEWWSKLEDALSVGLFPQYADEWQNILIEREA